MNIKRYETLILNSSTKNSERSYEQVVEEYGDDLLESDDFPDGYFEFFLRLISEEKFYCLPGLWHFWLFLSTEKEKMTYEHRRLTSEGLIDNYLYYKDSELCLAACDYIAYNYSYTDASRIFGLLAKIESKKSPSEQGFVAEGMRKMEAEKVRNK